MPNKQSQKNAPPKSPGRPKGSPNKTTALLKDALLIAAEQAGGKAGMIGYLKTQASENPAAFLSLLGKVLPLQVTGEGGGPIRTQRVEIVAVRAHDYAED